MSYVANTPEQQAAMLRVCGKASLAGLFADIPAALAPRSFNLPAAKSEIDVQRYFERLADRHRVLHCRVVRRGEAEAEPDLAKAAGDRLDAGIDQQPLHARGRAGHKLRPALREEAGVLRMEAVDILWRRQPHLPQNAVLVHRESLDRLHGDSRHAWPVRPRSRAGCHRQKHGGGDSSRNVMPRACW